jgi:hypothetical protein
LQLKLPLQLQKEIEKENEIELQSFFFSVPRRTQQNKKAKGSIDVQD